MTVGELIDILARFPRTALVVVSSDEEGNRYDLAHPQIDAAVFKNGEIQDEDPQNPANAVVIYPE